MQKQRTEFGIHPVLSRYNTAHRTEPSLSREGGESNVGRNTNEKKLQQKPDGIRQKETISKAEGNLQLFLIQSTVHFKRRSTVSEHAETPILIGYSPDNIKQPVHTATQYT